MDDVWRHRACFGRRDLGERFAHHIAGARRVNARKRDGFGAKRQAARWEGLPRFIDDDRIEIDSNIIERPKSWLFAGSDRGADRAAFMGTLIMTARLNDIDPQAWLADVLVNIADTPISRLEQLLPWGWTPTQTAAVAA